MEAVTTIERASMMVWLIPAQMVGLAIGNSREKSFCLGVEPKASVASTNSLGICLIAKLVKRTVGGKANITEAKIQNNIVQLGTNKIYVLLNWI